MTSGWVQVFHGGLAEALIVQSKLEAFGIPTLLPGRSVREIDPFITGASPLSQSVEVPPEAADEARVLLAERGDGDEERVEPTPEELESKRLAGLGRNLRWAGVFSLMVPIVPALFGLWVGVLYLSGVRASGSKPNGHVLNLIALVVAVSMGLLHARMLNLL